MALNQNMISVFGTDNFAHFEQKEYAKYQEMAEESIISKLHDFLNLSDLLEVLKRYAAKGAYRFVEYRDITIRLKSGESRHISSPVFLRAKSKQKVRGRKPKRRKCVLIHLGLELLGMSHKISPALMEVCISMAVLCPSFEVAANALRGFDIKMNDHLLQSITKRVACLAKQERVACCSGNEWKESGLRILVSVDGGRIRERCVKQGRFKKGAKRHGYSTDWFEPRLLIITQFDQHGKKIQSIPPILDGSCGNAKQNVSIVKTIVANALKLADKERKILSDQIRDLLWAGDIHGIEGLVKEKLKGKGKERERLPKRH